MLESISPFFMPKTVHLLLNVAVDRVLPLIIAPLRNVIVLRSNVIARKSLIFEAIHIGTVPFLPNVIARKSLIFEAIQVGTVLVFTYWIAASKRAVSPRKDKKEA